MHKNRVNTQSPEWIEENNKTCRSKHAKLQKLFYDSLQETPIAFPPDPSDDETWFGDVGTTWEDEEMWPKINQLLTKREQEYFDGKQLYCHLRARQWDIPRALEMIRETLRWRREAKPWSISCDHGLEGHFKSGKNYHLGWTRNHRPTVIMRVRLDVPGDNVGKMKTILYQMERSLRLIKARIKEVDNLVDPEDLRDTPPHEQVALIFDCKNFAKKDIDFPLSKELARVFDHYPEKLGVVFAVDTPIIFRAFWKVARTFLDERTVKKCNFVSGVEGRKNIFPLHYDSDQLEVAFCGTNEYHYNHEAYYELLREEEAKHITILTQPASLGGARSSRADEADIDYNIQDFEKELDEEGAQEKDSGKPALNGSNKKKKNDKKG